MPSRYWCPARSATLRPKPGANPEPLIICAFFGCRGASANIVAGFANRRMLATGLLVRSGDAAAIGDERNHGTSAELTR